MTAESERTMRREFTEALRLEARAGWTKAVANHFSVAVAPGSPRARFNPSKILFANVTASALIGVDSSVDGKIDRPEKLDPTAPAPQSPLHQNVSYARCVIQAHAIHATVLACLVHSRMPVIDQNIAVFHDWVLIDTTLSRSRLRRGGCTRRGAVHRRLQAGDGDVDGKTWRAGAWRYGRSSIRPTILFRARGRNPYHDLPDGRLLRVLTDVIVAQTAAQNDTYPEQANRHFAQMMNIIDREELDYRA